MTQDRTARIIGAAGVFLAAGSFTASVFLWDRQGNEAERRTAEIQESRAGLERLSCLQRNRERRVQRRILRRDRENVARIPDGVLEALGFTRTEALAQLDQDLRQFRPLDCDQQARRVRGDVNMAARRRGGGGVAVSPGGSNPGSPSEPPSSGGGSDETPEPGPQGPKGEPGTPAPQPEPPPIDTENPQLPGLLEQIVDGVKETVDELVPPVLP